VCELRLPLTVAVADGAILPAVAHRGWGTRIAYSVAAGLALVALVVHSWTWWRIGAINWPAAMNISGLLLLTVVGAIDLPRGRARFVLGVVALLLIVPSAFLLWLR
jgi:hypothetical protein